MSNSRTQPFSASTKLGSSVSEVLSSSTGRMNGHSSLNSKKSLSLTDTSSQPSSSRFLSSVTSSETQITLMAPIPERSTRIPITAFTSDASISPHVLRISPNGLCGNDWDYTCQGSFFGQCCGRNGFCGDDAETCGNGCNNGFGLCNRPEPVSDDSNTAPSQSLVQTSTNSPLRRASSSRTRSRFPSESASVSFHSLESTDANILNQIESSSFSEFDVPRETMWPGPPLSTPARITTGSISIPPSFTQPSTTSASPSAQQKMPNISPSGTIDDPTYKGPNTAQESNTSSSFQSSGSQPIEAEQSNPGLISTDQTLLSTSTEDLDELPQSWLNSNPIPSPTVSSDSLTPGKPPATGKPWPDPEPLYPYLPRPHLPYFPYYDNPSDWEDEDEGVPDEWLFDDKCPCEWFAGSEGLQEELEGDYVCNCNWDFSVEGENWLGYGYWIYEAYAFFSDGAFQLATSTTYQCPRETLTSTIYSPWYTPSAELYGQSDDEHNSALSGDDVANLGQSWSDHWGGKYWEGPMMVFKQLSEEQKPNQGDGTPFQIGDEENWV
ncbi:hypothetical protein BS50DRAFT_576990 [Corynespora cassiicola Philippines]|uniref:Chitin-binding type-1 domain-containing protein n=1 Tax=Corynespora cassiicola Philippines TaxID=1448308 RepID=A0A2T2NCN3_CORCC|nr:hypothetical protein BS50DRAFT_576990 [Corynespora cassiicola Philippines]